MDWSNSVGDLAACLCELCIIGNKFLSLTISFETLCEGDVILWSLLCIFLSFLAP